MQVAGKETEWMTGIHDQRLIGVHRAQILHDETKLRPIREHLPIATIGYLCFLASKKLKDELLPIRGEIAPRRGPSCLES